MRLVVLALAASACAAVAVPGTYPDDEAMWLRLVAAEERLDVGPERPVAAIAPHHLIDGPELGSFWKALSVAAPARVVVVIGPDHRRQGRSPVTVADRVVFETPFGAVRPDTELVAAVAGVAGKTDGAFVTEHSVHVHGPFVKRFFPGARVLALIVHQEAPRAALDALVARLNEALPPDALLVASVDFSHYQPEPWASFHDESSWSAIAGFELENLFEREVDSPESLYVAMRFTQLRGAQTARRVLHTNSQRKRGVYVPDSTSHFYVTFTPGPPKPEPSVSVMVMRPVAGLGLVEHWKAVPELAELGGQEDRFFRGADFWVFGLQEEVRRELRGMSVVFSPRATAAKADCVVVTGDVPADEVHGVTCTPSGVRRRVIPLTAQGLIDVPRLQASMERE